MWEENVVRLEGTGVEAQINEAYYYINSSIRAVLVLLTTIFLEKNFNLTAITKFHSNNRRMLACGRDMDPPLPSATLVPDLEGAVGHTESTAPLHRTSTFSLLRLKHSWSTSSTFEWKKARNSCIGSLTTWPKLSIPQMLKEGSVDPNIDIRQCKSNPVFLVMFSRGY